MYEIATPLMNELPRDQQLGRDSRLGSATADNDTRDTFFGPLAELYPAGVIERPDRIPESEWNLVMRRGSKWSHPAEHSGESTKRILHDIAHHLYIAILV